MKTPTTSQQIHLFTHRLWSGKTLLPLLGWLTLPLLLTGCATTQVVSVTQKPIVVPLFRASYPHDRDLVEHRKTDFHAACRAEIMNQTNVVIYVSGAMQHRYQSTTNSAFTATRRTVDGNTGGEVSRVVQSFPPGSRVTFTNGESVIQSKIEQLQVELQPKAEGSWQAWQTRHFKCEFRHGETVDGNLVFSDIRFDVKVKKN